MGVWYVTWVSELTTASAGADGPVAGILRITANVPNPRVQQAFALKVVAVHVLHAPEAAGGDDALLSAFGKGLGGGLGVEVGGAGGEGAEDASQEGRGGRHYEEEGC